MNSAHCPSAGLSDGFKGPFIFPDFEAEMLIIIGLDWMCTNERSLWSMLVCP